MGMIDFELMLEKGVPYRCGSLKNQRFRISEIRKDTRDRLSAATCNAVNVVTSHNADTSTRTSTWPVPGTYHSIRLSLAGA